MGHYPHVDIIYGYYVLDENEEIEDVWEAAEEYEQMGFDAFGDEYRWTVAFGVEIFSDFGIGNKDISIDDFNKNFTKAQKKVKDLFQKNPHLYKIVNYEEPKIIISLGYG